MPFRETLKGIVEGVEGGLGVILMGYDGIAIDEYIQNRTGVDLHLMAVEYATLVKELRRTADILDTGGLEEMVVCTGGLQVVMRIIDDDLFIFLALDREGNLGKGRYLLRRELGGLRERLS